MFVLFILLNHFHSLRLRLLIGSYLTSIPGLWCRKQKREDIKNVFVSKNITFYFQLQSETCNILVTLLNKIVKNTADNEIHYRYTSKQRTQLAFKLT